MISIPRGLTYVQVIVRILSELQLPAYAPEANSRRTSRKIYGCPKSTPQTQQADEGS